jgi:hypothetical protein
MHKELSIISDILVWLEQRKKREKNVKNLYAGKKLTEQEVTRDVVCSFVV